MTTRIETLRFPNRDGITLVGKLERPPQPRAFVVFAHCFTCTKNLSAVRTISRALQSRGLAVLRFDFAGLGESEGEFAQTNFSSNISDLEAAADYLAEHYEAPTLLVGHSLGGAAAIQAACRVESVRAVATIGAPYRPSHVRHLLEGALEELEQSGSAEVRIGGRPFRVKRQFLEDLENHSPYETLRDLRKALLILHSPQDQVVSIENAAAIYKAAFHPKSFVSLDGADHLLSNKADAQYAGEMIACWAQRYLPSSSASDSEGLPKPRKTVMASLGDKGLSTEVQIRQHRLTADEPEKAGGEDRGATPHELLSAGLGACTAMTLQLYARRKSWPLESVHVHLDAHPQDSSDRSGGYLFERLLELKGALSPEQRQRLLQIAEKCPVHKTLTGDIEIHTSLFEDDSD